MDEFKSSSKEIIEKMKEELEFPEVQAFGGTGIFFGVNVAKRNLTALVVTTAMAGVVFILGLYFLDVQLLVISGVFIAGNLALYNVPKLRYQFY